MSGERKAFYYVAQDRRCRARCRTGSAASFPFRRIDFVSSRSTFGDVAVDILSLAKLIVFVEPVDGELSILADLDDVAIGITHVTAPFPAVRIG